MRHRAFVIAVIVALLIPTMLEASQYHPAASHRAQTGGTMSVNNTQSNQGAIGWGSWRGRGSGDHQFRTTV